MNEKINFSDRTFWGKVAQDTYPLQCKELIIMGRTITLVGNGKLWSNSPYITSGGNFLFEKPVQLEDVQGIKTPILIKSSNPIDFDSELKPILVEDYLTFILDLSGGKEEVWTKKIQAKTRTHIRKAEKSGYEMKIGKLDLLEDYYSVISTAWRDLGTPTHSKKFYENILKHCDGKNGVTAQLMILYLDGFPASGACFIYDDTTIYHPYSATLKQYNKYALNSAMYWQLIQFAIDKNLKFFDMGRSRKGQSTVKFKLNWGAVQQQLYYYYLNKDQHKNDEDGKLIQFLINMWKKLPLKIANFLGPHLIYKVLK